MTEIDRQKNRYFADTSKIYEILKMFDTGLFSGITTNPLIIAKDIGSADLPQILKYYEVLSGKFPDIPISIQLLDKPLHELIKDGREFAQISPDIVIKVPMFSDGRGLQTLKALKDEGLKTNTTALMKVEQLALAVKAGSDFVSLFFNRIKDTSKSADFNPKMHGSADPEQEIRKSREYIDLNGFVSKIITGSIRVGDDVIRAENAGSHIVTVTPKIFWEMVEHPQTSKFINECQRALDEITHQK